MARTRAASSVRGWTFARARWVARFTSASRTPATPRSASSTRATHDAHVMPVTTRSRCAWAGLSGGLETGVTGRATTRTLRSGRAAATTHQYTGRIGVDHPVRLLVERRFPTAARALVAWPCGSREQPEAGHADHDEEQHHQIHQ